LYGQVGRLLTSALVVDGPVPAVQIGLTGLAAAGVVRREGAATWWGAALAGHVGSALLSYGAMSVAAARGSESAREALGKPDFGVSCVFGGTAGALLVTGVRDRARGATAGGALGCLAMLALSRGWHGSQHGLSAALGAGLAAAR
jgi:hypothetical protein